jgi:outer membrane protein TolC
LLKILIIITLSSGFVLNNVSAEFVLTWEECVKEAKKNHPGLISAGEKLKQTQVNKVITASSALPQISSSVSEKSSKTSSGGQSDTYSYTVTGRQLLFDGFKTASDVKAALKNIDAAEYRYRIVSSNVRLRLRSAFVASLKARESLTITKFISDRRKQNVDLVKLRYKAGREHKGSLLTAEANLAEALFEVKQAKRKISLSQRRMSKELGRKKLIPFKVKGNLDITNLEKKKPDFENLAKNVPVLKEFIVLKEAARFGVKSARADFFPQIYLNASAGKSDSDWPPDEGQWSAGISLSLPLFEGKRRRANMAKAKSALKQAEAEEQSGFDSVILTLEETWINFQDAIDKVAVQKKFLKAAEERAEIAQAQYSTGLVSFDNWTIIEDALVRAKKFFLEARAAALIAEAKWIQAKGETLDYDKK